MEQGMGGEGVGYSAHLDALKKSIYKSNIHIFIEWHLYSRYLDMCCGVYI